MRYAGGTPRNGDQLELRLFPGEPWDGRSPRALTRVGVGFILKPGGGESGDVFVDPEQYDLWPPDLRPGKKAPRIYLGAPLLQDLLEGDRTDAE